jgi:hypothetical protein
MVNGKSVEEVEQVELKVQKGEEEKAIDAESELKGNSNSGRAFREGEGGIGSSGSSS